MHSRFDKFAKTGSDVNSGTDGVITADMSAKPVASPFFFGLQVDLYGDACKYFITTINVIKKLHNGFRCGLIGV